MEDVGKLLAKYREQVTQQKDNAFASYHQALGALAVIEKLTVEMRPGIPIENLINNQEQSHEG